MFILESNREKKNKHCELGRAVTREKTRRSQYPINAGSFDSIVLDSIFILRNTLHGELYV